MSPRLNGLLELTEPSTSQVTPARACNLNRLPEPLPVLQDHLLLLLLREENAKRDGDVHLGVCNSRRRSRVPATPLASASKRSVVQVYIITCVMRRWWHGTMENLSTF